MLLEIRRRLIKIRAALAIFIWKRSFAQFIRVWRKFLVPRLAKKLVPGASKMTKTKKDGKKKFENLYLFLSSFLENAFFKRLSTYTFQGRINRPVFLYRFCIQILLSLHLPFMDSQRWTRLLVEIKNFLDWFFYMFMIYELFTYMSQNINLNVEIISNLLYLDF